MCNPFAQFRCLHFFCFVISEYCCCLKGRKMRFLHASTNTFAGDNKLVLSNIKEALLGNQVLFHRQGHVCLSGNCFSYFPCFSSFPGLRRSLRVNKYFQSFPRIGIKAFFCTVVSPPSVIHLLMFSR